MTGPDTYGYANDFMYFVLRRDRARGEETFLYCSGVNLAGFLPLTGGRHGLASNPALRGLQLVNLDVRALALSQGATPKSLRTDECNPEIPRTGEWYSEVLLLENVPGTLAREIVAAAPVNLLRKILKACLVEVPGLPDGGVTPGELQALIERLCTEHGRRTEPR